MKKIRPCIHCRKMARGGLWCPTCIQRGVNKAIKQSKKSTLEKKAYRDLDYLFYLRSLIKELEK